MTDSSPITGLSPALPSPSSTSPLPQQHASHSTLNDAGSGSPTSEFFVQDTPEHGISYEYYRGEEQLPEMSRLIEQDLSEPYSVYTYRYFLMQWPHLCFLAKDRQGAIVGLIINRLEPHRSAMRGYVAMLCVRTEHRGKGIASALVTLSLAALDAAGADECVLEAEVTNKPALALYERLGFVRDKRLGRYYLNGGDAFRLKRWFPRGVKDVVAVNVNGEGEVVRT